MLFCYLDFTANGNLNEGIIPHTIRFELAVYFSERVPVGSSKEWQFRGGPVSRPGSMWGLWWTKRHWGRLSPSTVSPANHSTNFSITRGRHNRPNGGRSA
jgi:hypothetical protein